ncbi:hypothetical protein ACOMHN_001767 [Nucella lapillus]
MRVSVREHVTLVKSFFVAFLLYLIYIILYTNHLPLEPSFFEEVHQKAHVDLSSKDSVVVQHSKELSDIKIYPSIKRSFDDRILSQMNFIPGSVENRNDPVAYKLILYIGFCEHPTGTRYFHEHACAVNYCELTTDIGRMAEADVMVLREGHFVNSENRAPWQITVLYTLESPEHTSSLRLLGDKVNWTATYRHDSTLVTPYEKYVPLNQSRLAQLPVRNYASGKTKMVAWFVSNCQTANKRGEYVKKLSQYIRVDIYGACGYLDCPRGSKRCSQLLNEDYRFYLAFENSNCRDYITEKFFVTGLQHNIIPIVMGAAPNDYRQVAPLNSFLHVDEFSSPFELANYLHFLSGNDKAYNSYFGWKGLWQNIDTLFPCRLCALAHDVEQRGSSWYRDIDEWWAGPAICIGDRSWPRKGKVRP